MGKVKDFVSFIGGGLSSWKYFLTFLITSLVSFLVMYKFTMLTVANQSLEIFIMMSGINYTFLDLFVTAIIALLFGVFVSLFVYKFVLVRQISKTGILGSIGLAVGLFSLGCPTCGAFFFMLLGFPLALMYLPWGGMELKVLSILFLVVSNYLIVRGMTKGCKI
ncbi:MAG: hypothetical protein KJ592_03625 [Nanoarchaeota archaeon]|nr:hypothetical protein [Nanoarchaeota archaeon]